MMFMGEYQHKLDSKKRLAIPVKFRAPLSEGFVVCKAPDHCLYIYSKEEWEPVAAQIQSLPGTEEFRRFKREFFRNAELADLDSQGRFIVKSTMLDYADITSEVVIIGSGNKLEVWNADSDTKESKRTLSADELGVEVVF